MKKSLIIICLLLVFPVYSVQAEDLSRMELPLFDIMHGMKVEWVAKKMVYNGHPMTIQNFKAHRKAEDIMQHYESRWKVKGLGKLKHQVVGDQLTIGFESRGYSYSVQAKDVPGGSQGTLVVTRNKAYQEKSMQLPVHPDAKVVSRIHSVDDKIRSETLTVSSSHAVALNKHWYRSALSRNGWVGQSTLSPTNEQVIMYQKGKELCQLTFIDKSPVRDHRSMVMIHWIKG